MSLVSGVVFRGVGGLYFGIAGPPALKDNGCKEQTRRVSTSALRRRAQNSCAPRSLDPFRVFAAARKSDLSKASPSSILNCHGVRDLCT